MARVFLDTNIFIDFVEQRADLSPDLFLKHEIIISPLSIHILFYVAKRKIPYPRIQNVLVEIVQQSLNEKIAGLALQGPTNDFEDNVQLHSSATAKCDLFLTSDKGLLKMKFFGQAKIFNKIA